MNPSSNIPRRPLRTILSMALLFLAAAGLHAEPLAITLSGAAEVPPVVTSASASGEITVLPNRNISGSIKVTGMVPTKAHIHEAAVGKNGPPIITLTFSPDNTFAVPADSRLSEAQFNSFTMGNLYVNVHSAQYPDGEIRAQIPGKPMRLAQ
ncbi:CHRD domain-containing protein [Dechloromonas denitrificans]|uniref:CHRD domain-containing protein n=1 Tax=Dechloromonas denitrificans TaxID=281362 RepID=A0A133XLJ9_9RHOO|nr:CHRD domain-containing protein [Dechloromonas denitrificans]KXB31786.1 CHRD domain-containing protein [Dechloromonas denitrificans]